MDDCEFFLSMIFGNIDRQSGVGTNYNNSLGYTKGADVQQFSSYLQKLYRGAMERPTTDYKDWALNEAKSLIPFDSCVWGSGSWNNDQPCIHTVHLHELDNEFVSSWLQYQHEDKLARDMPRHINRSFNVNVAKEYAGTLIYEKHCKRFKMEHIVATANIGEDTRLMNTMALYRANPNMPFSEDERLLKEMLFPHWIEAVRLNWLTNLPHMLSSKQQSSFNCIAACDTTGILQVAMPSFVDTLRQEWPKWTGPALPSCIIEAMPALKYAGEHTVLSMHPMGDLLLLRVRARTPADDLSPREFEIAQKISEGIDYKTIAQCLDISPATVKTHTQKAYLKLGINDKAQLAAELGKLIN